MLLLLMAGAPLVTAQVPGVSAVPTQAIGSYFDDRRFVTKALQHRANEIAISQLAVTKTKDMQIKEFASAIVKEDVGDDVELVAIATQRDMSTPTRLDSNDAGTVESLESKTAQDFDAEYLQHVADDNHKGRCAVRI